MMKKLRCGSLFDGIVRVYEFVRERRGFDPRPPKSSTIKKLNRCIKDLSR